MAEQANETPIGPEESAIGPTGLVDPTVGPDKSTKDTFVRIRDNHEYAENYKDYTLQSISCVYNGVTETTVYNDDGTRGIYHDSDGANIGFTKNADGTVTWDWDTSELPSE